MLWNILVRIYTNKRGLAITSISVILMMTILTTLLLVHALLIQEVNSLITFIDLVIYSNFITLTTK